jgi:Transposase DNA-binding
MNKEARMPDVRLYERLERLVEALSKAPEQSIPQACGSVHETKAAYRFLG